MGTGILFVINLSQPSFVTRGLLAIVRAHTIEEAREKIAHLDNDYPAPLIFTLDWTEFGPVDDFEYAIFEYWE